MGRRQQIVGKRTKRKRRGASDVGILKRQNQYEVGFEVVYKSQHVKKFYTKKRFLVTKTRFKLF